MSYKCEIFEQVAQPTLTIRTHTPVAKLPQVLGKSYGAIGHILAAWAKPQAEPPL